jgi:mono/diheme cytochrome c family protein
MLFNGHLDQEALIRFLDDELDEQARQKAADHLLVCERCRAGQEDLRLTMSRFVELEAELCRLDLRAQHNGAAAATQRTSPRAPVISHVLVTIASAFALCAASFTLSAQQLTSEQVTFFETHVRPVLHDQCYGCHTSARSGGLSLASREDVLQGGSSGPAVVPGDPSKSLLIKAVEQTGDLKMPEGGKLTAAQIADLAQWIKDGAYWPVANVKSAAAAAATGKSYEITEQQRNFWSFQPLQSPKIPEVKDNSLVTNDIDRFVVARLEKEGLKPAPLADRRTLLRRVTYALTGLMPTYDEVQAFEKDKSPNAYENVVDRLLASARYGERWGRLWLDLVRYSEDNYRTPGFKTAPDRTERFPYAYEFRDWIINALNQDLPYDTFVKAQLAADLMPGDNSKYITALGMNGLGVWHWDANPAVVERSDEWNDKVDTTTRAFLGLTVACARCHNHKYDPIPQKDYYRLASVFASSNYHAYPLVPQATADDYEKQKKTLEKKEAELEKFQDDVSELLARTLFARTDEYMVAAWRLDENPSLTVAETAKAQSLDEEMLQRWVRFLKKRPVNYPDLKPWQAMVARHGTEAEARELAAKFHARAIEVVEIRQKLTEENAALKAVRGPKEGKIDLLPNGSKRVVADYGAPLKGLERESGYLWKDLFEEDLSEYPLGVDSYVNGTPPPGLFVFREEGLRKRIGPEFAAHLKFLEDGIAALKQAMPPQYPFAYGLADKKETEIVKVELRGSPYSLGEEAPPAYLQVLSPPDRADYKGGSGRLELADDIVKSPLAQRVIVNRIWRWAMGTGIVNTPSNFGMNGERPSNPELLEYLTAKFVDGGMSWKKLEKEIVMSRTFQLSSTMAPDDAKANENIDADNRLYWRANRRRMEAEGIWDNLLESAGELDLTKTKGPSEAFTDDMHHRGVFGWVSRMTPDVFQQTWDFPVATLSSEGRLATNVPPQRLFFLNSTVIYKRAGSLAKRVEAAGELENQIRKVFEIVYQRDPSKTEVDTIQRLVLAPLEIVESGSSAEAMKTSPLLSVCWAALSSNEFLYVD